jgi:hypothetical protein
MDKANWTAEAKAQVPDHTFDMNDGKFYMDLRDFKKAFVWFVVLRYDENWKKTQWRSEQEKGYAVAIRFENPVE